MRFTDHLGRPIVVVTGTGIVTSLGQGKAENWAKLASGTSGIHRISRFSTDNLRTTIAGTVDFLDIEPFSSPALSLRLAELAIDEAVREAKIGTPGRFPGPLYLAVPPVELEWPHRETIYAEGEVTPDAYDGMLATAGRGRHPEMHELFLFGMVGEKLADRFGTEGSPISLSTACASGATTVQLAVEALRRGETTAALCVGTDGSVQAEALIRFSLLSALSTANDVPEQASKPFSKNRDGFVMAEGGAALVLETLESAVARGAEVLAVVEGIGEKADSFHRTRSNPDGSAIIATLKATLEDAGRGPQDIDYINAHGTSTPENDKMEHLAIAAVFGDLAPKVPMSSNKSMIGHTLTAAGAVEAVFSVLTMREGFLPPTINYTVPDPAIALDVVPNVGRAASPRRVISNSFGFGGQNVSLLFAAEPA